ncbi:hypothetical protein U732_87 [Clostridium argentinense CDC 2741]|uniref:Apea-like HEPN domain-containing protein n=2 Tax=Clostridium argentinense TaxID=29341 RepID=A0A0C1R1C3_9CLOT|nr:hypothetical protein [Clostridium argentinense]ARC83175.1 hypothetical protein RSJ17_00570 [Clostridium argentinense]KIE44276.1 hypothetical protein U732_87 [Clostridium argentinense CDC 2741]NFF41420.1 hypothetical protein [Clostridium argentinense]NFP52084.1 hypothetical protein [Clostridium argentinense]NFP74420.1 hypothetical protein [Clostridium argentinense]
MIINLGFKDNKESNLFLRALWANFSKKFGKCSWHYQPFKDGSKKIIFLGHMDINLPNCFSVYIHYKKRAVIDKMEILDLNDKEISKETSVKIQKIAEETLINFKELDINYLNTTISSYNSISNYYSDFFTIEPYSKGLSSLTVKVKAFGDDDAEFISQYKITKILDLLSVLTNAPFYYGSKPLNSYPEEGEEFYYDEEDFIDGYPIRNNKFILEKYGKQIIERIFDSDSYIEDDNINKLLNASMHFHTARKFDAQINDLYIYHKQEQKQKDVYHIKVLPRDQRLLYARDVNANIGEIATVSYISALETISSIIFSNEVNRCKSCNQLIYSISAKVKDLLYKYFPESLAKQIHSYYNSRSKFLHEGKLLNHTYTGVSIPQLDYNHPSGCRVPIEIPLINLREYTGYCIRSVIKEYLI